MEPVAQPSDRWSPWMRLARELRGLTEIPGHIHEARILSMWARLGIAVRDDETPWCAAFVGWCLEEAGIQSSRSGAARSYLKWGRPLYIPRTPSVGFLPGALPYGAIVVLDRPGSSWSGHVGFYVGQYRYQSARQIQLLAGNQGNAVNVRGFPATRVLGVYWPEGLVLPPTGMQVADSEAVPQSESEA